MAARLGLAGRVRARRLAPRRRSARRRTRGSPTIAAATIKAVAVVHNETSTGVTSRHRRRAAGDRRGRTSGAAARRRRSRRSASIDYRHDEWGVDVTVGGSQKGLMLPPGPRLQRDQREGARGVRASARLPRAYWDWEPMISDNAAGFFPYTPATNLLYGLREAVRDADRGRAAPTCSRGTRGIGEATRRAVAAWGLEMLCAQSRGVQQRADRGGDARGPRRRRVSRRSSSSDSTCRSARASASSRARSSASATSATSTT